MYLIVLGAGPVGMSLVELALKDGHDVALIEPDPARAQAAASRCDCLVLNADIAEGDVPKEAGLSRAQALIATTEDDAANLMATFLGAEAGIERLISVVNHPNHRGLFQRLGAHVLVDPEVLIARHLYGLVRHPQLEQVIPLPGGAEVFELTVKPDSPLVGRSLAEAATAGALPEGTLIVLVRRGEETLIPSGKTAIQADDRLVVFSQNPLKDAEVTALTG